MAKTSRVVIGPEMASLVTRAAEMSRIAGDTIFSVGIMAPREDIKVRAESIFQNILDLEASLRAIK